MTDKGRLTHLACNTMVAAENGQVTCMLCASSSNRSETMFHHLMAIHKDILKNPLTSTGQLVSFKRDLVQKARTYKSCTGLHLKQVFYCGLCPRPKMFKTREDLIVHMGQHSGQELGNVCPLCLFALDHADHHDPDGPCPLICGGCEKRVTNLSDLKLHYRVHFSPVDLFFRLGNSVSVLGLVLEGLAHKKTLESLKMSNLDQSTIPDIHTENWMVMIREGHYLHKNKKKLFITGDCTLSKNGVVQPFQFQPPLLTEEARGVTKRGVKAMAETFADKCQRHVVPTPVSNQLLSLLQKKELGLHATCPRCSIQHPSNFACQKPLTEQPSHTSPNLLAFGNNLLHRALTPTAVGLHDVSGLYWATHETSDGRQVFSGRCEEELPLLSHGGYGAQEVFALKTARDYFKTVQAEIRSKARQTPEMPLVFEANLGTLLPASLESISADTVTNLAIAYFLNLHQMLEALITDGVIKAITPVYVIGGTPFMPPSPNHRLEAYKSFREANKRCVDVLLRLTIFSGLNILTFNCEKLFRATPETRPTRAQQIFLTDSCIPTTETRRMLGRILSNVVESFQSTMQQADLQHTENNPTPRASSIVRSLLSDFNTAENSAFSASTRDLYTSSERAETADPRRRYVSQEETAAAVANIPLSPPPKDSDAPGRSTTPPLVTTDIVQQAMDACGISSSEPITIYAPAVEDVTDSDDSDSDESEIETLEDTHECATRMALREIRVKTAGQNNRAPTPFPYLSMEKEKKRRAGQRSPPGFAKRQRDKENRNSH